MAYFHSAGDAMFDRVEYMKDYYQSHKDEFSYRHQCYLARERSKKRHEEREGGKKPRYERPSKWYERPSKWKYDFEQARLYNQQKMQSLGGNGREDS